MPWQHGSRACNSKRQELLNERAAGCHSVCQRSLDPWYGRRRATPHTFPTRGLLFPCLTYFEFEDFIGNGMTAYTRTDFYVMTRPDSSPVAQPKHEPCFLNNFSDSAKFTSKFILINEYLDF